MAVSLCGQKWGDLQDKPIPMVRNPQGMANFFFYMLI